MSISVVVGIFTNAGKRNKIKSTIFIFFLCTYIISINNLRSIVAGVTTLGGLVIPCY